MNTVSTQELVALVFFAPNSLFEVRLRIGIYNATHLLFRKSGKLFDEGIDGEKRRVSFRTFLKQYEDQFWLIDNVIESN